MKNFIIGVIGGIGNIVPGLSGGALLVILGLYQKCITAITEIVKFKNLKQNILFLIPIGLGVIVGTVAVGNLLLVLLNKFPMQTSYAFVGFLLGTIPMLFKEANKNGFNKKYLITFSLTIFVGIILLYLKSYHGLQVTNLTFLQGFLLGLVLAGSTIIPGISSTVLLSVMGYYDYYLTAVSSLDIISLFPIMLGLGIGAIGFIFLINFLLKKYYGYTYYAVSGFCIATIPAVLRGHLGFDLITLFSLLIAGASFSITYYLGKKANKN